MVDEENHYLGVIAQHEVLNFLVNHNDATDQLIADVLQLGYVKTLTPDMSLDEAQEHFSSFAGERLPVVSSQDSPRLLGVVYKSALLEKYSALKRSFDASSEVLVRLN